MSYELTFTEIHGALQGAEKAFMVEIADGVNPFHCLSRAIPQGARAAYQNGVLYVKAVVFDCVDAVELQV